MKTRRTGPARLGHGCTLPVAAQRGFSPVDVPASDTTLHPPRTDGNCATCREQWPCLGARAALLVEYADARAALSMYLAAQMTDFIIASKGAFDTPTYDRFLGWVRPAEPPPGWMTTPTSVFKPFGDT